LQRLEFRRPVGELARRAVDLFESAIDIRTDVVHVSTERQCHWALTSAGRRLDLFISGRALFLDGDHFRRLRPERGHRAGEVEDVAFTPDAKNHPRMFCGHRFWLRALRRVWKANEFRWHSDTTLPLLGVQKLPTQPRSWGGVPRPESQRLLLVLFARVVIDGVLGAPVPAPSP
jgi:hypothetical protein